MLFFSICPFDLITIIRDPYERVHMVCTYRRGYILHTNEMNPLGDIFIKLYKITENNIEKLSGMIID